MIFEVARTRAKFTLNLAVVIESPFAKAFICELIVVRKIKRVLDERSTRIRIVADTITPNPWI